jgi:hypothetical protein
MKKSLILVIALIVFSAVSSFASTTGNSTTYNLTLANRSEIRNLFPGYPTFATVKIEDQGDCVQFTVDQINTTLLTSCTTGNGVVVVNDFAFNCKIDGVTVSNFPANYGYTYQDHDPNSQATDGYGTFEYIVSRSGGIKNAVPILTFTACKTGTDLQIEDFEEESWLKDGQVAENGLRFFAAALANFCVGLYEPCTPVPPETTCQGAPINSGWFAYCPDCTQTLIELSSFTATPGNKSVTLNWVTEAELDNAGFNILRSLEDGGPYEQINADLIPAKGSTVKGAKYKFIDRGVQNRETYHYIVEDVDSFGIATQHGPVSATPRSIYAIFGR